jgi:phosphate-selective porin OprO/OprP
MSRLARSLVQMTGRLTVIVILGLAPAAARAQKDVPEAPPPAPAVPPPGPGAISPVPPVPPEPAVPPTPPAPAPTAAAALPPATQDRLEEIDQRTRIIARKQELAEEAAAAKAKEAPLSQTDEGGFALSSPDRQYQVRFKGLLQFDGRAFLGNESLKGNDGFLLRKIRPILAGTLLGLVDFFFSPDFAGGTLLVTDAYLDVHPASWLRLRVGKFKEPLGLERLQADQDLAFIERALDQNLTPQREVGAQLWGDVAGGILRYEAGIFNGNGDNTISDVDSNEGKTYEGRVFIQPFNVDSLRALGLGRLGLGVGASTGNERGSAANSWLGTFKSNGQLNIFSYLTPTDTTQTVIALARHTRVNPQLYYYNGPFGLLGEYVREHQELGRATGTDTAAVNNSAGHITVSAALGGFVTYEGVKPKKPLDLAAGTFGAVELAFRYNWLNIDPVVFQGVAAAAAAASVRKAQGFGIALNWQLSREIKASGNYEQTSFTGGAGTATAITDRRTEKALLGRFQVAF